MPNRTSFFVVCIFALIYFMFEGGVGDRSGILPISYTYVVFLLGLMLIGPFIIKRRIEKNIFWTILALALSALLAAGLSGSPATFMYALGPVFLVVAWNPKSFSPHDWQLRKYAKFFSLLLLLSGTVAFVFFEKNSFSGRFFLSNVTNPNYTSMLYFAAFLAISCASYGQKGSHFQAIRWWSWGILIASIILTGTRSTMMGVAVVLGITFISKVLGYRWVRRAAAFVVFMSAFGQLLIYFVFQYIGVADLDGRGGVSIFDASNLERVTAYYTMFSIIAVDPHYYLTGVGDVGAVWRIFGDDIENVPHNWFMMMWVSSGALYTITLLVILGLSCFKLPVAMLPWFSGLMISAGIIGRAALYAPLVALCIGAIISSVGMHRRMEPKNDQSRATT